MDQILKPFLLVIVATVIVAVSIYSLIVKLYEYHLEKRHALAQEVFAKTANLNLKVEATNEELFKRDKK